MDKYEYKVKVDTIKEYIGQGKYHDAAEIADGIDWRKCKSSMMLCTISDLYKVTKQYNEAKKLLLSTSLSIADVAEQSGYGDYRVFTKVFKKSEGITPSQYRRDFLEETGK